MLTFLASTAHAANELVKERPIRIRGAGGGGKGGGKAPSSDANTLRTKANFRLVEAISEGPIWGLVDGEKSIYFDQTPIQGQDSKNWKGIKWELHKGLADEGYFNGHAAVEATVSVETKVTMNNGPITRTIVDENVDAVRVIIRIPSLVRYDDKGAMKRSSVSYTIEVRAYNGSWTTAVTNNLNDEKNVSPAQIAHRVELPLGGAPWDIRVRRNTADSTDEKLQNETWWEGYITLTEGKFMYPHTAAIAMAGDAEQMGSSIPPRSYHVKGLLVNVPSNYDPEARTYNGIWDGTFKIAWTNNPAWIFYDLLINDRYGLGEFIKPEIVDKWSLYTIAQYCDQPVKSGYKNGDTGEDIFEPRFTFNGVINTKDEAFFVLQSITKAWRGMGYWALGQVFATADIPSDPVRLVGPSNVINGEFDYAGTAEKARHSVILVKWNNPDDFYKPDTEVVIDTRLLHEKGWRDKSLQLTGCTSRGLAHRYGKWVIDTEQHETDTLTYSASWDHAELRPGEIIAVSDPRKANIRAHGRVVSHKDLVVELDAPFEWTTGETYQLMLTMPDGSIETKSILAFLDEQTVRVASAFSKSAGPDATWTIKGSDITPRLFRVISVDETEPNIFKVTALFHDPLKYARIEDGILFEPLPYERSPKLAIPPTNLLVRETGYISGGQQFTSLTISWTAPENFLSRGFIVSVDTPDGESFVIGSTNGAYMELSNTVRGEYRFYVQTIGMNGLASEPATISFTAKGEEGFAVPTVTDLTLLDRPGTTEFTGRDLKVTWKNNFAVSQGAEVENVSTPHYSHNTVSVYRTDTGELLRTQRALGDGYIYDYASNKADNEGLGHEATRSIRVDVTVSDVFGRESEITSNTFRNPVPALVMPKARVDGKTILFSWKNPAEDDFAGVNLWVEKNPGFDPKTTEPFYTGMSDAVTFPGEEVTAYHVRLGVFDTFGQEDINISPELLVNTERLLDVDPPAIPENLTLSTSIDQAPDGTLRAKILATVKPNTEDDFATYFFQIKEENGNFIGAATADPIFEWTVTPGRTYTIQVRALDRYNNASDYSAQKTIVAARDNQAPAIPTEVHAVGLFRSIWFDWKPVADTDISHYDVETTRNGLASIHRCVAPAFIHSNLTVGDKWTFRVRAIDTSGNISDWSAPASASVGAINPGELPPDALVSTFALIDDAFIESAQIVSIDAAKLRAGSVIAGSVHVATSAGNLPVSDPAAIVNAGETQIEPGFVKISGSVTLADWRYGPDETTINGGALAANTVEANAIVIGMRGITTDGIVFEHNAPDDNWVSWTAGTIRYIGDDGKDASRAIEAGAVEWTTGYMYLIWLKGTNKIVATLDGTVAFGSNAVILAMYAGGRDLTTNYGRTVIDGASIKTGSITAASMQVGTLSAITADLGIIRAGRMESRDGKFVIDLDEKFFSIEV